MSGKPLFPSRRAFLEGAAIAVGAAAAGSLLPACRKSWTSEKIKVGVLLPYTGVFSDIGQGIDSGLRLAFHEAGDKLGGREIEYIKVDDEADPAKATTNTMKLVVKDKVDFLIGTVHSGVAMGMTKIVREEGTICLIPCAGLNAATRENCAPNIFRTANTNWQYSFPMGDVILKDGYKEVVTFCWNFAAPLEAVAAFKESFLAGGGRIIKELMLPSPNVEFQAHITEIAALKPQAVFVWFTGEGGSKFVKEYAAAGLKEKIPIYAPGLLTEEVLDAQGPAAEGIKTTMCYSRELDLPQNVRFREAYKKATGQDTNTYSMFGYDTGKFLVHALDKVKGDTKATKDIILAMEAAEFDSPRGKWTMSKAHNPIQDIYVRQVRGGKNVVLGVAHKALADPVAGCKMP